MKLRTEPGSTQHYLGPSLLLSQAREVILMGPRTRNAQKTVKTRRKWVFFILRNQSVLKLKKVVHTTVYSLDSDDLKSIITFKVLRTLAW